MPSEQAAPARVLVCYGSESGSTKRLISRTITKWQNQGATFECQLMSGNEAVEKYQSLQEIAKQFDVLLISTCSYGLSLIHI